jgi:hypothetical protein
MNFIQNIKDSVETSVNLKLFPSLKTSSYYHVFNSNFTMFSISMCRDVLNNFNPNRLSNDPYPEANRPRGQKNLNSIIYHRNTIRKEGQTEPIWIALRGGEYTLLDGAHRIIATYLEKKQNVPSYIIDIPDKLNANKL